MRKSFVCQVMLGSLLAQSFMLGGVGPSSLAGSAYAQSVLARVSSIELESTSRYGKGGQKIRFIADMPFQYRVDVLNDDQIQLTLQNARLSDALINTTGLLNIVPGGAVESAALKPGGAYEQIVLSGPGLGRQDILVEGAVRAATAPLHPQIATSSRTASTGMRLSPAPQVTPAVTQATQRIDISDAPQQMTLAPATTPLAPAETQQLAPLTPDARQAVSSNAAMPTGFIMPAGYQQQSAPEKTGTLKFLAKKLASSVQNVMPSWPDKAESTDLSDDAAPISAMSLAGQQAYNRENLQNSAAFHTLSLAPSQAAPQPVNNAEMSTPAPNRVASRTSPQSAVLATGSLSPQPERQPAAKSSGLRLSGAPSAALPSAAKSASSQGPRVAQSTPAMGGPQIVEIVSARSRQKLVPGEHQSRAVFREDVPIQMLNAADAAPEPSYVPPQNPASPAWATPPITAQPQDEYIRALPRYQGGGQPITATLAGSGEVLTHRGTIGERYPAQAAPEMVASSMDTSGQPVNNLFYEDSSRDLVAQMMAQALAKYRAGDPKTAMARLNEALAVDPDNAKVLAAKGEILIEQKDYNAAEIAYAKAAGMAPDAATLRYAELLVLNQKPEVARPLLERYVQTNPKQIETGKKSRAHYMLGTLYQQAGEFPFALAHLREAADLQPESADIQYNLGLAYELQGKLTLAQTHYQKSVELNPAAADAQAALRRVKI